MSLSLASPTSKDGLDEGVLDSAVQAGVEVDDAQLSGKVVDEDAGTAVRGGARHQDEKKN